MPYNSLRVGPPIRSMPNARVVLILRGSSWEPDIAIQQRTDIHRKQPAGRISPRYARSDHYFLFQKLRRDSTLHEYLVTRGALSFIIGTKNTGKVYVNGEAWASGLDCQNLLPTPISSSTL